VDTETIQLLLVLLLLPAGLALIRELMIHSGMKPPKPVREWPTWQRIIVVVGMGILPGILFLIVMEALEKPLSRFNNWFYRVKG